MMYLIRIHISHQATLGFNEHALVITWVSKSEKQTHLFSFCYDNNIYDIYFSYCKRELGIYNELTWSEIFFGDYATILIYYADHIGEHTNMLSVFFYHPKYIDSPFWIP